jgi:glycosyltransferase involved in cell wall biosynthesis
MTRVLALVSKRPGLSPGQRFRLEQWSPLLRERHDIAMDFIAFESDALTAVLDKPGHHLAKASLLVRDLIRREAVLRSAADYDAVVIYREASLLGPAIYERLLARSGRPIIFDFDDAIWLPGLGSVNGSFARLRCPGKTAAICQLAAAVTVGNGYLGNYAKRFNANVHVIPTTIDLNSYPVQPQLSDNDPFVVTWTGSGSTLVQLELARAALARVGKRRRTVLQLICSRPPERPFEWVATVFTPWSPVDEARTLGISHVGIMPLPDNPFNWGKCGLKALLYMAVGRPAVVSPVGVNSQIVIGGQNGLIADSEDAWVEALEALADSPELRTRLGIAGRQVVEGQYSAEAGSAAFARVIQDVLCKPAGQVGTRLPLSSRHNC